MRVFCSLLAVGGSLFASSQMADLESRIEQLERQPITPPIGACALQGTGIYAVGSPLFWRVSQEGLEYAISGSFNLVTTNGLLPGATNDVPTSYVLNLDDAKTHSLDFNWDWGFRVGLGYDTPYDGWDLFSGWTSFHNEVRDSLETNGDPSISNLATTLGSGSGTYISPFWVAKLFSPPGLMNRASASWKLKLDLIDLELGRNFLVSNFLAIKPFIGLRNGWINQSFRLNFQSPNFSTSIISDPPSGTGLGRLIDLHLKNDFWGIGARGGVKTEWFLGKGFSLYGNAAFSFLSGSFRTSYELDDRKPV